MQRIQSALGVQESWSLTQCTAYKDKLLLRKTKILAETWGAPRAREQGQKGSGCAVSAPFSGRCGFTYTTAALLWLWRIPSPCKCFWILGGFFMSTITWMTSALMGAGMIYRKPAALSKMDLCLTEYNDFWYLSGWGEEFSSVNDQQSDKISAFAVEQLAARFSVP